VFSKNIVFKDNDSAKDVLQDHAEGPLEGLAEGRYAKRPCEEPCNTSNAHVPISDLDFFLESVKA